uniref:Uncharacterized protein n=1 Tax=Chenopodium quinoa TaxID=63459 RepID=A0A803M605_CHEQI
MDFETSTDVLELIEIEAPNLLEFCFENYHYINAQTCAIKVLACPKMRSLRLLGAQLGDDVFKLILEKLFVLENLELYRCNRLESGTSHLKRHLERCANRPLGLTFEEDSDEENFVFDMNELRKEIFNFIVEGGHSFTMVEEQGFRRMMKRATPKFKPFDLATTKRDLLKAYVLERDKLKDLLSNVLGRICLTTDNWKSNHTRQHFICVTSHFVDDSWKLRKKILRFRALAPPYDGVSIANEICMFLCQWKLDDRILSITVDNATYNDPMIFCLNRCLVPRGGLSCGETLFHVRCCAHIIILVVQKGLTCSGILDKIRSIIKLIIKSSHRSEEFYDCAEKILHLDVKRKLNLDMHVRWNSTYKMLGTSLYFKDVFLHLRSSHASFQSYIPLRMSGKKQA